MQPGTASGAAILISHTLSRQVPAGTRSRFSSATLTGQPSSRVTGRTAAANSAAAIENCCSPEPAPMFSRNLAGANRGIVDRGVHAEHLTALLVLDRAVELAFDRGVQRHEHEAGQEPHEAERPRRVRRAECERKDRCRRREGDEGAVLTDPIRSMSRRLMTAPRMKPQ